MTFGKIQQAWISLGGTIPCVRKVTTGDNLSSTINGGSLPRSLAWPHVTPSSLLTHAESIPAANERLNTHAEHLHLSNHAPHEHQSSLVPCNVRWLIIFRPCHRSHFNFFLLRSLFVRTIMFISCLWTIIAMINFASLYS